MKEIAKRLNVSVSTVSRALRNHHSIGLRTRQWVHKLAQELNYEKDQSAISFNKRKTFTLGVILPNLSEGFFSAAINGIYNCANTNSYSVLMAQSHDNVNNEISLIKTMKNHRVDGVLISIAQNTACYKHFETLNRYNIPVVFFDRIPNLPNIHYVACNLVSGTIEAINFLFKKGHRVVGMINGPERLFASQERKEGYITAMIKTRLKFDPSLIVNTDLSSASIISATKELLSSRRKPTAIITFNDYVALDAVQYAQSQKLRINKDICFVSYANEPWNKYTMFPPLASVEQFPYLQGQKATEIILDLLHKKELKTESTVFNKVILDSQLVIKGR